MKKGPSLEQKLHAVIGGARAILQKDNFIETARAIFDYCRQLTGAVSGYVALLNVDGTENEVLFLEAGGLPCSVDPNLPMPIRGLRETVYKTHKAAYENDFMNSKWLEFMPKGHVVMRNVMFAPINLKGKTVGVIGLANKPGDFTDQDAETSSWFGELASISLKFNREMDKLKAEGDSLLY
ncbi:GAF domain-containing protein [Fibrobacterota bacterium]